MHLSQLSLPPLLPIAFFPDLALLINLRLTRVQIRVDSTNKGSPMENLPENKHNNPKRKTEVRCNKALHAKRLENRETIEKSRQTTNDNGQDSSVRLER